jgi:hypothetical protein
MKSPGSELKGNEKVGNEYVESQENFENFFGNCSKNFQKIFDIFSSSLIVPLLSEVFGNFLWSFKILSVPSEKPEIFKILENV